MNEDQILKYRALYDSYLPAVARCLEELIHEYLVGVAHIDRVSARAKSPSRFEAKARKMTEAGAPKYAYPLSQIQDQIGARVIVFYRDDVNQIGNRLEEYFTHIEKRDLVPDSQWAFGYFGRHWILSLPDDAIPTGFPRTAIPRFFELQVKTLFQHAWSEANHDLGYKAPRPPTPEEERLLAFTAAQAWGADEIFDRLRGQFLRR